MAAEVIDAVFGGRRAAYAYNGFQAAVLEKTKLLPFFLPFFSEFSSLSVFRLGKDIRAFRSASFFNVRDKQRYIFYSGLFSSNLTQKQKSCKRKLTS